ncbi:hypothetical protein RCH07_003660 [Arthrobacter sp. CG_A4]|nr:hypothetical protein [Arthrobacter sp. CG_A4]
MAVASRGSRCNLVDDPGNPPKPPLKARISPLEFGASSTPISEPGAFNQLKNAGAADAEPANVVGIG